MTGDSAPGPRWPGLFGPRGLSVPCFLSLGVGDARAVSTLPYGRLSPRHALVVLITPTLLPSLVHRSSVPHHNLVLHPSISTVGTAASVGLQWVLVPPAGS